ncbi:hypothetical protein [Tabrizicola fusiformis]|uniref:hypothetical protein n=1 Tax=Tabrizicola sp. SY72 TaxID=2741673 RepID=UPI001573DC71|nr:hypothetical protein [Tabrizicola sp. SY72]NTT86931.1 hypothetical protein [Tabrizicola sp. SY72]
MTVVRRNPASMARLAEAEAQAARELAREARRAAFAAEADPLYFKVQRGEASQSEYDALVAAIRARHPYPKEPING